MKVIQQLSSGPAVELPGAITGTKAQLHHEASPGVFVHVSLTPGHLAFTHSDQQVAISMDALLAAVREQAPGFAIVQPQSAR